MTLNHCQQRALTFVRVNASRNHDRVRNRLTELNQRAGISGLLTQEAADHLSTQCRIALHFHPERLSKTGRTVVHGLLEDGQYKNQFETGLSSGSPSAFEGGERDEWERRLFGGAYHTPGCSYEHRPRYGALQVMHHPDGPSPRFGSCYFLLNPAINRRSTFTFGGSQETDALENTSTSEAMDAVLLNVLERADSEGQVLGVRGAPAEVVQRIVQARSDLSVPLGERPLGRALDSFVEVQVHGVISLDEDIEHLVADPAFRSTAVEELFRELCDTYQITLDWHAGFSLEVEHVPAHFRGYPTGQLARRITRDGAIDAAVIGKAANDAYRDMNAWADFGARDEVLTCFRRLWHALVLSARG